MKKLNLFKNEEEKKACLDVSLKRLRGEKLTKKEQKMFEKYAKFILKG